MRGTQLGTKFQSLFQWRDCPAVVVVLKIRLAQTHKARGERRFDLSRFAEFHNRCLEASVLLGLGAGLHMLQRIRRLALCGEEKKKESANHGRSGSRISIIWSE